jgi:hypothetical protein
VCSGARVGRILGPSKKGNLSFTRNSVSSWASVICIKDTSVLILKKGVCIYQAMLETVEKLPPPMNVKSLRSFLDHAGFYRKFIKDFSKITKPLT